MCPGRTRKLLAIPAGLEPATRGVEIRYSGGGDTRQWFVRDRGAIVRNGVIERDTFRDSDRSAWAQCHADQKSEDIFRPVHAGGRWFAVRYPEQMAIKFHGFSTDPTAMFTYRSARYCDQVFGCARKTQKNKGFHGGRTRDRTLDLSRVKGTLSLVDFGSTEKLYEINCNATAL
jgi:hypothetical protein